MKRKTNLFYTSGNDSKFITFSNYTESLTGNFLSTDTKLFPSRFLCMNISSLYDEFGNINKKKKAALIKYLVEYYESKLAVLRDNYTDESTPENTILPLNYLLEALMFIKDINEDKVIYDFENINSKNYIFDINYISDITEQDHNGTYTDTICLVDMNDWRSGIILHNNIENENEQITIDRPINRFTNTYCLYGWDEQHLIDEYKDSSSIFDAEKGESCIYNITSRLKGIKFNKEHGDELKFNIIIPLFDVTDINYKTNFSIIADEKIHNGDNVEDGIELTNSISNNMYTKNVPLGLWFADSTVILKKDEETGFAQSWSLVISSQFKPFPYSKSIPNEVTANSKSNSFATFAQILSRQNDMINEFNKLSYQIADLSARISAVESKINNIGTTYNIDKVHTEMLNQETQLNNKLDVFKQEIYDYINNIRWNSII